MSPNQAHNNDPTPLATNVGDTLDNSSLFRLLGRIEQKCDGALKGLDIQSDQIRGLHTLYNEIRKGVTDASRMRQDLDEMKRWRDDREESGKVAAVAARTRAEMTAEQAAAADKSVIGRARSKFIEGASQISGSMAAGALIGWLLHLIVEYIKGKP